MIKVLLSGCCGKMGKAVANLSLENKDIEIIGGVDLIDDKSDFPIFTSFNSVTVSPDVIIDFSNVTVLDGLLECCLSKKTPVVIATTGYNAEQIEKIKKASKIIPVFFSANMSLGISLISTLAKKAASILGSDFDIEIVEKHHNRKLDAPSGTAIMLANAVNSVFEDTYTYEYDRHSKRCTRPKNEIGIHSVRGGTIVGEHEIIFAGQEEIITISHSAQSKGVFASGALAAARFIANASPGLYDMNNIINL